MNVTNAKIILFMIGAVLIGAGMRTDNPMLRWIGIAFLAAAFLLRFVKKDVPE